MVGGWFRGFQPTITFNCKMNRAKSNLVLLFSGTTHISGEHGERVSSNPHGEDTSEESSRKSSACTKAADTITRMKQVTTKKTKKLENIIMEATTTISKARDYQWTTQTTTKIWEQQSWHLSSRQTREEVQIKKLQVVVLVRKRDLQAV